MTHPLDVPPPRDRPGVVVDHDGEAAVAAILGELWGCTFHPYGEFDHIDWWIERDRRMVGVAELKARNIAAATFDTVYLAFRKYVALQQAALGANVPALFVVRFTDLLAYINVGDVSGTLTVGGNSRNRYRNDVEPLINVPVASMVKVPGWPR